MKKSEVSFYQLTVSPLEKALPPLLDKIYARGLKAHVLVDTEERLMVLDNVLWTFSTMAFLPHGIKGDPQDHPIWLSCDAKNKNQADVLVVTQGEEDKSFESYERVIDIFDGNTSLQEAKKRYQNYKSQGFPTQFWVQTKEGRWEKHDEALS